MTALRHERSFKDRPRQFRLTEQSQHALETSAACRCVSARWARFDGHDDTLLIRLAILRTNIGGGSGWEHLSRRNKRQSIWFPDHEAVMERFYFHLRQGDQLLPDDEGVHLPDFAAGQPEALARELFAEAIKSGKTRFPDAFVIADEAGRALDIIPLAACSPEPLKQ
jgi:hypothetical protein